MAQQAIAQALAAWREGERLLAQLPPLSRDHESVALAVNSARDVYVVLSRDAKVTASLLHRSQHTIADARRIIAEASARSEEADSAPRMMQSADR